MALNAEDIFALFRETDRKFQETDRLVKELAAQSKETDRKIKALAKNLGNIGNRLGRFVEEMIRPAVIQLFNARGIEVHEIMGNVSGQREGAQNFRLTVKTNRLTGKTCRDVCVRSWPKN